ncbi:MAG: energy transducer TonB [Bacteroidales bacterium]|nr:energy transducer TonB [Bacteroidales bacterium]
MEAKKSPKADLEKKKGLFLEIGLVATLAIVLLAFNIKSYDQKEIEIITTHVDGPEEVDVDITRPDEPPPPPPEPEVVTPTELNVVADNVEVADVDINAEDDQNQAQQEYVAPVVEDKEEEKVEEEIFTVVESAPEYPGGEGELYKYLAKSIKYPEMAKQQNLEGRVFVTFVVEKDGSIANPKVLRDIGGGCGEEAIRVVRSMPKWKPGKQRGKAVRVQFNLPVMFQLE